MWTAAMCVLTCLATADGPPTEDDAKKLLGNWVAVSLSRDGQEAQIRAGLQRLVVTPDNWGVEVGRGSGGGKTTWKIDATRNPKGLDLVQHADAREIITRCLYEIRGSWLYVCQTAVPDHPPPQDDATHSRPDLHRLGTARHRSQPRAGRSSGR